MGNLPANASYPQKKNTMRHFHLPKPLVACCAIACAAVSQCLPCSAQTVEGVTYYLPQALARFTVKVEKTVYRPGKLAVYARQYLKVDAPQRSATTYRLIGLDMTPVAVPDTAKRFTLTIDRKHSVRKVSRDRAGALLAINADARPDDVLPQKFTPAPRPAPLNPTDYMSEDILNAGSLAKMAELTAREIYDIRDSRDALNRGEADFMPKDGAQLKTMLANLDTQERALTQLFEGTATRDTAWLSVDYLPRAEGREVLFRLSRWLGLVDNDDLAGEPYYVDVRDNHTAGAAAPADDEKKKDKNDIGLRVSVPSKITLTVCDAGGTAARFEMMAPQFGVVEKLSGALFGKKQSSRLLLDPLTGAIRSIDAIEVE
jgi:hypothetical protein